MRQNAINVGIVPGGGETYTFPSDTGTLVLEDNASSLSNKDISGATNTLISRATDTSTSTPTPTGGSDINHYSLTALATNCTFAAPSGTPKDGNRLTISIRGTTGTLGFNAIYNNSGFTVAASVIADTTIYLGYLYDTTEAVWNLVAYQEVEDL